MRWWRHFTFGDHLVRHVGAATIAPPVARDVHICASAGCPDLTFADAQLDELVRDFATAISRVDAVRPVAVNQRSGVAFQPGIGPHTEANTIKLVMPDMASTNVSRYGDYQLGVPYEMALDKPAICASVNLPVGTGPSSRRC